MKITKRNWEKTKHLYKDSVRKEALQAILAERFIIVKVDLFCLNVTSNQLLQNMSFVPICPIIIVVIVVVVSENISFFFGLGNG